MGICISDVKLNCASFYVFFCELNLDTTKFGFIGVDLKKLSLPFCTHCLLRKKMVKQITFILDAFQLLKRSHHNTCENKIGKESLYVVTKNGLIRYTKRRLGKLCLPFVPDKKLKSNQNCIKQLF